jgi:disulfide bond formation protein DsbB
MNKRPIWLWLIFIQSLVATLWSLYLWFYWDPILNFFYSHDWFNPANAFGICDLCRYARILMYPLVLISWVALIRNDNKAYWYMIPSVVLGLMLETFHYTLQMFPIETSFKCTAANPCMAFYVRYFGFLTIPWLCWVAFIIIFLAILRGIKHHEQSLNK